jgi:hypothetical protein
MYCENEAETVFSGKENLPDVGVKFACAYGSRFAERSETSQLGTVIFSPLCSSLVVHNLFFFFFWFRASSRDTRFLPSPAFN